MPETKYKRPQTPRRGASDERNAAIAKVVAMLAQLEETLTEFPDDVVAQAQLVALRAVVDFLHGRVSRVRRRKGGL